MFSIADYKEEEDMEELRTRKIRIFPTKNQKTILNKWRHTARKCYNDAVGAFFKANEIHKRYYKSEMEYPGERVSTFDPLENPSKFTLRDALVTSDALPQESKWMLEIPKDIRAASVFEARANISTLFTSIQNGHIKHFSIPLMKRKNKWSFAIPKSTIKVADSEEKAQLYQGKWKRRKFRMYPEYTGDSIWLASETLPNIDHDCRISFDGLDRYYLHVPVKAEFKSEIKKTIYSLDPGVRTFQTIYTPDHPSIKIGEKAAEKILQLATMLDSTISKKYQSRDPKMRSKFKKRAKRLRRRIQFLQDEMHKKTAKFLCDNARAVLIPKLVKPDLIRKTGRKLRTKTVRQMSLLGHCKFLDTLKNKALIGGVDILIVNESYTSKTCKCGEIVEVGSKEVFKCHCEYEADRDVNGSRNIFIRAIRKYGV
jgi:transposase